MTPRAQRPRTGGGRCLAFGLPTSNAPACPQTWKPTLASFVYPLANAASSFNQHDYAAASLIVIDEAARVSNGKLVALSTPAP